MGFFLAMDCRNDLSPIPRCRTKPVRIGLSGFVPGSGQPEGVNRLFNYSVRSSL